MFMAGIIGSHVPSAAAGEYEVTSLSSGSWVCPEGVTNVSVVLVGAGGSGVQTPSATRYGGGGGALVYKNDVPVVPGTSYPYSVDRSTGTVMFGMTAGCGRSNGTGTAGTASTAGSPTAGFNGGAGGRNTSLGAAAGGGNSATYTADGTGSAKSTGIGLYGTGSTGPYGAGGVSVYTGSPGTGGSGAIRIIWGSGRSFPANAA